MRSEPSLYQRLTEFALDDESASFKFSNRLARENGWSLAFAKKAIDEYKKFVYLAAISQTQVTPSDIVDQVWHLHLTYSRSYWDEMCGEILGKRLHHGPTMGGAGEDAKYRNYYAATLEAYAQEFVEEAPAAYWPPSEVRFEGATYQRWVDTREHLVLSWRTVTRSAAGAIGVIALSSAGAAFAAGAKSESDLALGFSLLAVLIAAVVGMAFLHTKRTRRNTSSDDGSSFLWFGGTGSGSSKHHNGDGHGHGGEGGVESGGGGSSGCGGGGGCSGSS